MQDLLLVHQSHKLIASMGKTETAITEIVSRGITSASQYLGSLFTWQSPCCCTRSSISHGQLSCFVFQAKLELRTSQNSVDCKITARPIELHCYTPRKQLISYLVCAKAVFAFLCQAQQNTIKPISSTLSQNVMNVGCRSKLCLIHQIKSITS